MRRRYLSVDALRRGDRHRDQRHVARPQPGDLGRRDDGLRVRLQALRRLGPEPHDAVARPLRRSRHHDLLARRAEIAVHPLPAQVALLVRGRVHDRGRGPPLHRDGGRSPVRRFPRPEHGGVRVLSAARLPAPAAAEGDPQAEAVPAGRRPTRRLPEPPDGADEADRLGADPPAVRPDGQVRDGASAWARPRPRRSCGASRATTCSTRPTRRSRSSARRSRRSSCAATCTARGCAARSTKG